MAARDDFPKRMISRGWRKMLRDHAGVDGGGKRETTEARLSRWESIMIKCFAILFLILFLSEKAVKEAEDLWNAWAREVKAPTVCIEEQVPAQNAPSRRSRTAQPRRPSRRQLKRRHDLTDPRFQSRQLDSHVAAKSTTLGGPSRPSGRARQLR